MRNEEILLQPRDAHIQLMKRLGCDLPYSIPIAEMEPLNGDNGGTGN